MSDNKVNQTDVVSNLPMSELNAHLPLGKSSVYLDSYEPSLLCAIPRQLSRQALGLASGQMPFVGVDIWNAYELSWLNAKGKPIVAMAQCYIPADSPCIIESKSFKLYLNTLNQTHFDSIERVHDTLIADLSQAAGAAISINITLAAHWPQQRYEALTGRCIDDLDISVDQFTPQPSLLQCETAAPKKVSEQLVSHLFRSLCPVTGQPDWASVCVNYSGQKINADTLLRYLIAYRQHQDFHEQCVERIFLDISEQCKPSKLTVFAHFVRRGGLDINPYRSTDNASLPAFDSSQQSILRLPRQ